MATMSKASEVTSLKMRAIMPSTLKMENRKYVQVNEQTIKTVDYMAVNVYNAKDEKGLAMKTQKGNEILNKTIYVGFNDGTFTTLKNDVALAQVFSVLGDLDLSKVGSYEFGADEFEPFETKFIQTDIKMGKNTYKYWVFDPQ